MTILLYWVSFENGLKNLIHLATLSTRNSVEVSLGMKSSCIFNAPTGITSGSKYRFLSLFWKYEDPELSIPDSFTFASLGLRQNSRKKSKVQYTVSLKENLPKTDFKFMVSKIKFNWSSNNLWKILQTTLELQRFILLLLEAILKFVCIKQIHLVLENKFFND